MTPMTRLSLTVEEARELEGAVLDQLGELQRAARERPALAPPLRDKAERLGNLARRLGGVTRKTDT